ncbi:MAG: CopG family transcriptional regulator [Aeromonadaceae bacterium]
MGLSDLKKKKVKEPGPAPHVTIDEFINDAELYALGHPKVVSPERSLPPSQPTPQPNNLAANKELKATFKKATYSMSVESIDNLNLIAEQDGFNKSQLLRLFTHYFYHLPPEERDLIYERFKPLFEHKHEPKK